MFEMPPGQPAPFGPATGRMGPAGYPRAALPTMPKVAPPEETAAEGVPANLPGGVALPFDPMAKADLPFDLPDLAAMPLSSEPAGPAISFDLPAAAPLNFDLPAAPPVPSQLAAGPSLPPASALPEAQPAPEATQAMPPKKPPAPASPLDVAELEAEQPLHFCCPSGHTLQVPRAMLGKQVACPLCHEKLLLRPDGSLEYQQKRAQARAREETKVSQLWLSSAIAAAIIVIVVIVVIIATSGRH
jgi:hypothetical protein